MATLAQAPFTSLTPTCSLARRETSSVSSILPVSTGIRGINAVKISKSSSYKSRFVVRSEAKNASATGAGPVNDATFKELVLDSPIPVLVDFWAPWCGPCRMIAPLIDELSLEYQGKLKCVKLNTDESPGVATEYGIRSIPTVMIFKKGKKLDTVIGAVPKATLVSTIDKYLN